MTNEKTESGIDPAALAAAAIVAALTVIAPPGPYGPNSMIIGATILLLVFAYDVNPHRSWFQSLAFAAVIALVVTLILGYPLECICSQQHVERIKILLREKKEEEYSEVPPGLMILFWFAITGVVYFFDRKKRHRGKGRQVATSKPPHHK
jgi:hypothetical protein